MSKAVLRFKLLQSAKQIALVPLTRAHVGTWLHEPRDDVAYDIQFRFEGRPIYRHKNSRLAEEQNRGGWRGATALGAQKMAADAILKARKTSRVEEKRRSTVWR